MVMMTTLISVTFINMKSSLQWIKMLHFHVLVTVTSALITQLAKSLLDTKVSARQKQMHVL